MKLVFLLVIYRDAHLARSKEKSRDFLNARITESDFKIQFIKMLSCLNLVSKITWDFWIWANLFHIMFQGDARANFSSLVSYVNRKRYLFRKFLFDVIPYVICLYNLFKNLWWIAWHLRQLKCLTYCTCGFDGFLQVHAFFICKARLKLTKNQANAKQHPETELLIFEIFIRILHPH